MFLSGQFTTGLLFLLPSELISAGKACGSLEESSGLGGKTLPSGCPVLMIASEVVCSGGSLFSAEVQEGFFSVFSKSDMSIDSI